LKLGLAFNSIFLFTFAAHLIRVVCPEPWQPDLSTKEALRGIESHRAKATTTSLGGWEGVRMKGKVTRMKGVPNYVLYTFGACSLNGD